MKITLHFKCSILKWSIKVWIQAVADLNFTELLRLYTHTAPQSGSLLFLPEIELSLHLGATSPGPGRVLILVVWPHLF